MNSKKNSETKALLEGLREKELELQKFLSKIPNTYEKSLAQGDLRKVFLLLEHSLKSEKISWPEG